LQTYISRLLGIHQPDALQAPGTALFEFIEDVAHAIARREDLNRHQRRRFPAIGAAPARENSHTDEAVKPRLKLYAEVASDRQRKP
jgi:hypothetical protein